MSKYTPLTNHLKRSQETFVTLSFGELKTILGAPLPSSAWDQRTWWANATAHSQGRAWMDAGFEVEAVNLNAGTVRFVKKREAKPTSKSPDPSIMVVRSAPAAVYQVSTQQACPVDVTELRASLEKVAAIAGAELQAKEIEVQWHPAPHKRPSSLPADKQAVYCFVLNRTWLKVGKAGDKSTARYVSQHYYCKTPSTLAKSILSSKDRLAKLLQAELQEDFGATDEATIGKWLETNCGRLNILIPASTGPHVLSLVEAFLHVRLQPLFEGHA